MSGSQLLLPRWQKIVHMLYLRMSFISGRELGEALAVTPRTIRNDIKAINPLLQVAGNQIESLPGVGYRLIIEDEKALQEALLDNKTGQSNMNIVPLFAEDRANYIIRYLLLKNDYVKLETLAEELFVSKSTINSDILEVKEKLTNYSLSVEKRAGYGIRISGTELAIRFCYSRYLLAESATPLITETERNFFQDVSLEKMLEIVVSNIAKYNIHMTDISVKNLIIHIAIAVSRVKDNCYITATDLEDIEFSMSELRAAQNIMKEIELAEGIHFPESEISYILLHLSAKNWKSDFNNYREYIIVDKILEQIKRLYGYDFRQDQKMVSNIALHLKPAINRIKFKMNIQNPYLENLKENYPFAFELGLAAKEVLETELKTDVNEAEAGYLAIHFLYGLDKEFIHHKQKVLIVCASGLGTSQLLESKVRKQFASSLEIVGVYSFKDYKTKATTCDFVISTVPLQSKLHPVIQVSPFLTKEDVQNISLLMKHDETENQIELEKIFREGLFIVSHKTNKMEILADLAGVLQEKRLVGEDYLPSLMEREEIVPTYLGSGLAAPHPVEAEVLETVIAVCICPAGVDWNGEKRAQVVFMLAVKNEEQKRVATLYTLISDLVENPKVMGELKRVTDFENFMRILQTV
ncbi:sugar transporter [Listeria ivanovii]|uniref:BglG family transcription antiterminator n=1 Tax=Listeria ivanovii TaxID=1638 RepID=UPI000DAAA22C|nr:BglG family transcription antiterminator [Listeria ivanovii]PZG34653.1 sugar transporter [Listeria ivanovii]PZG49947.1 sugar transporter [Listeria ivanovii]PZH12794.1 sugar transporter [Listeria ivanovii]